MKLFVVTVLLQLASLIVSCSSYESTASSNGVQGDDTFRTNLPNDYDTQDATTVPETNKEDTPNQFPKSTIEETDTSTEAQEQGISTNSERSDVEETTAVTVIQEITEEEEKKEIKDTAIQLQDGGIIHSELTTEYPNSTHNLQAQKILKFNPVPIMTSDLKRTIDMMESLEKKSIYRGNMFNLQDLGTTDQKSISPIVSLEIKGERINRAMTLSEMVAKENELQDYLLGQTLIERVGVWAHMANVQRMLNTSSQRSGIVKVEVTQKDLLLYDGDILLTLEDAINIENYIEEIIQNKTRSKRSIEDNEIPLIHSRVKRKFTSTPRRTWSLPIRYTFDSSLNTGQRAAIRDAIYHWQRETCIRFVEDTTRSSPYILFRTQSSGGFCGSSPVGMTTVRNAITIICFNRGVISHEIGHTIGFWHEHQRSDRDDHIELIEETTNGNYAQRSTLNYGVPYDVYSVLHYGPGNIRAKDGKLTPILGQRAGLSFWDSKLANLKYCARSCPPFVTLNIGSVCRNGGYLDPNHCLSCPSGSQCFKCRCQVGFKGTYCRDHDTRTGCGVARRSGSPAINIQILQSPRFPNYYYRGAEICAWTMQATGGIGRYVRAWFVSSFDLASSSKCVEDFVEVRYKSNKGLHGPRYCGNRLPTDRFTSENHELMVVFQVHSGEYNHRGFRMNYRYIQRCGLCTEHYSPQIACTRQLPAQCSRRTTTRCGLFGWRRCTKTVYYSCTRTQKWCCRGSLSTSGNLCVVDGCGGCSDRVVENQPACNRSVRRTRQERYSYRTRCGWTYCTRYAYRQRVYYVREPYCCNGFSVVGSRCVKN